MTNTGRIARLAVLAIACAGPVIASELEVTIGDNGRQLVTNVDSTATASLTAAAAVAMPPLDESARIQAGRQRYRPIVERAAAQYGLPVRLVEAVIEVESAFNPTARSSKGASGLMQLMPETARSLGVRDIWDPASNIDGGTRYLAQMMSQFGGDHRLALAGYNAGPNAVIRAGGVPRFRETIDYVRKVEGLLSGGHRIGSSRSTLRTVRRNDGHMHITNIGHTQSSLRLLRDKKGALTLTNR